MQASSIVLTMGRRSGHNEQERKRIAFLSRLRTGVIVRDSLPLSTIDESFFREPRRREKRSGKSPKTWNSCSKFVALKCIVEKFLYRLRSKFVQ